MKFNSIQFKSKCFSFFRLRFGRRSDPLWTNNRLLAAYSNNGNSGDDSQSEKMPYKWIMLIWIEKILNWLIIIFEKTNKQTTLNNFFPNTPTKQNKNPRQITNHPRSFLNNIHYIDTYTETYLIKPILIKFPLNKTTTTTTKKYPK